MAKGWHHTEEFKRKKSIEVRKHHREKGHPRIGMKHKKSSKIKMSIARSKKIGILHPCFKGRYLDRKQGYIIIQLGKKQVREHRFIMENHLRRPLKTTEIIHHINHIKTDNRIENLQIMTRAEHAKHHYPESKIDK